MAERHVSRRGLWNASYQTYEGERAIYGNMASARIAAKWLTDDPEIRCIEDWGCGLGGFYSLVQGREYIGVDGSYSPFADIIADLVLYRTKVDAIHCRHVLEHNPEWRLILGNLLDGFTRRAAVTFFTPLVENEHVLSRYPNFHNSGHEMVDIAIPKPEFEAMVETKAKIDYIQRFATDTIYLLYK